MMNTPEESLGGQVVRITTRSSLHSRAGSHEAAITLSGLGRTTTIEQLISAIVLTHLREHDDPNSDDSSQRQGTELLDVVGVVRFDEEIIEARSARRPTDPNTAAAAAVAAFEAGLVKVFVNGSPVAESSTIVHVDGADLAFVRLVGLSGQRS